MAVFSGKSLQGTYRRYGGGLNTMKLTAKQHKILSALYHDYTAIDTEADLRKRKISLADYRAIPEIFGEVQRHGTTKCFISSIAEYFKKHGFTVELELDNVNYNISI